MRGFLFACIILVGHALSAQIRPDIDLEQFAERLFQVQDEDLDYESIYESLLIYYTNPINLNKTSREELGALFILSPAQINSLFDHLDKNGPLISLYELQTVENFDLNTIQSIHPFVTVDEKADSRPLRQRIREEKNNMLLIRQSGLLEKQAGFSRQTENGYRGSPGTTYLRYRIQRSHDFSFGVTAEKDPGETYFDPKTKSPEFISAHASLDNQGIFDRVILGDYQLQYGQGLVFGAGFSAGKGAETVNSVKRSSTGVKPYASALESGFFRGIASTISLNRFSITSFYSRLRQDANLINDSTYSDFDEYANSIQMTGLHRTEIEFDSKNRISENAAGGALEYQLSHRVKVGGTFLATFYSNPIQKKPNNYNQFEFQGDQNKIGSFYATAGWQNLIFFGEVARSSSGGIGAVGGWLGSLGPGIDMSLVLRDYDRNFHSIYGNGFSEGSRLINEQGIYWGLKIYPNRKHELALYYDRFSFPWLRYQVDAPSRGFEYLGRYTLRLSKTIALFAQFREESKQLSIAEAGQNLSHLKSGIKRNYAFGLNYTPSSFSMKTRIQGSDYQLNGENTSGFVIAQDLQYDFRRLKLSSRFALFETDDFKNAQYLFEREVLYAFSIPVLNGTGARSYLLAQYQLSRKLTIWARVSRTTYSGQETIGSGLSEISGNKRTDYRLMMRIML